MTCLFGYPVFSDVGSVYSPSFTGGTWTVSLPLTNMQDRRLAKVARSSGVAVTDTLFTGDLGVARRIGVIGVYGHTLSRPATMRWRGFSAVPCYDSLTVGDATWSATGTPTRSAAAFTGADGVTLDLIGDDSAVAIEYFTKTITFTGNAVKAVRFRVARSSSASHRFDIIDDTAGASRLNVNVDFAVATPVVSIVGAGAVVSSTAQGDGSWIILCTTASVTAANTNTIKVYPDGSGVAANVASFYIGDVVAWDATSDQLLHDSGYKDVWRTVYPAGSLPSADPRLVDNKYSAEEVAALPGIPFTYCLTTATSARYWRCNINDTTNSAGHLDIGRVMLCDAVTPSINLQVGPTMQLTSASVRTETDGGAATYRDQPRRKEVVFTIDQLPEDETLAQFYEMQRRIGTTGQLIFVYDASDTYHMPRRAMPCVMKELSKLQYPWGTRTTVPFALIEEL